MIILFQMQSHQGPLLQRADKCFKFFKYGRNCGLSPLALIRVGI